LILIGYEIGERLFDALIGGGHKHALLSAVGGSGALLGKNLVRLCARLAYSAPIKCS
jgi:hypothetical protein